MASGSREPATEWDWQPGAEGGLATRRRQLDAKGVHKTTAAGLAAVVVCNVWCQTGLVLCTVGINRLLHTAMEQKQILRLIILQTQLLNNHTCTTVH